MSDKESMSLILVRVRVWHPAKKDIGAEMNFIFDEQPGVEDILSAYSSDPFWAKNEDRDHYGNLMAQCLRTYGVPKLNKFNLADDQQYNKAVPSVGATWHCNIVGRVDSVSDASFGDIRLTYKEVRIVTPPEPVKAEAPKAKTRTRGAKKTDKISTPPRSPRTPTLV